MKPEKGYATGVSECSDDIVFIVRCSAAPRIVVIDNDREGWPDSQILPDRSSMRTENLEIETMW